MFWSLGGRGSLVLRLGRVSSPVAVLINLWGSAELFQALRLDGNSFGGHFLIRLASSAHLDNQNTSEKIQHIS